MTGALLSLENHYQNAYITRDLDAAIVSFRTRHGFDGFHRYEISYELRTRAGLATASIELAEGGAPGQSQWLYVDARDTIGHYVEYCYMTPERWLQLGGRE